MQSQPTRQASLNEHFSACCLWAVVFRALTGTKKTLCSIGPSIELSSPQARRINEKYPFISYLLNVQRLNTVLNCSRRGQFLCSSATGGQSGILKVLSEVNCIPSANSKTEDRLSQLADSSSTNFSVGCGDVGFFLHCTGPCESLQI